MKMRYLLIVPIAALLMQVGNAISAPDNPNGSIVSSRSTPPSSPPSEPASQDIPAPPWARNLDLSAEQRSQLQTIHQQTMQECEPLHQQLMEAEDQLRSLLHSNASIAELRDQHQQVQQLRQQLDTLQFETLLAERQVLTPEQLAIVIQDMPERPRPPR